MTITETFKKLRDDLIELLSNNLKLKADKDHTHNYAGSSSAGGSANSAAKLDSSAGSETQPVYFSNGKPVATTHTLGKSVPSNAVFTDTTYNEATESASGLMSAADKVKLNKVDAHATKITVDSALSTTSTNPVQNKVVTTALNGKAASTHTHAASEITNLNDTLNDKLDSDGVVTGLTKDGDKYYMNTTSGNVQILTSADKATLSGLGITATATELNYTDGVTSNIQTQLDSKAASTHTHNYAGSSSAGGSATSAIGASSSKTNVTTSCLRNIQASTTDLTAGTSALTTGDIYIVYE